VDRFLAKRNLRLTPLHLFIDATGTGDEVIELPANSTDAAPSSYHVNRGLTLVRQWFEPEFNTQGLLNGEVIIGCIEMTRFPFPLGERKNASPLSDLVRAADLGEPII
jgi:hypothetical protein